MGAEKLNTEISILSVLSEKIVGKGSDMNKSIKTANHHHPFPQHWD